MGKKACIQKKNISLEFVLTFVDDYMHIFECSWTTDLLFDVY